MSSGTANRFRWFGLVTVAWTAGWCAEVCRAWNHAPYDRAGWGAAALWVGTLACLPRLTQPARPYLAAAWLASLLAVIGELHVAGHVALVCAVCAWLPGTRLRVLAGVAAWSWMPAFGWLLAAWSPAIVNSLRLLLAATVLGGVLLRRLRREGAAA